MKAFFCAAWLALLASPSQSVLAADVQLANLTVPVQYALQVHTYSLYHPNHAADHKPAFVPQAATVKDIFTDSFNAYLYVDHLTAARQ